MPLLLYDLGCGIDHLCRLVLTRDSADAFPELSELIRRIWTASIKQPNFRLGGVGSSAKYQSTKQPRPST